MTKHVLVVDDDATIRVALRDALTSAGFEVALAEGNENGGVAQVACGRASCVLDNVPPDKSTASGMLSDDFLTMGVVRSVRGVIEPAFHARRPIGRCIGGVLIALSTPPPYTDRKLYRATSSIGRPRTERTASR